MHVSEITNTTIIRNQQFTNNLQVQNTCGNPSFLSCFFFSCCGEATQLGPSRPRIRGF